MVEVEVVFIIDQTTIVFTDVTVLETVSFLLEPISECYIKHAIFIDRNTSCG